MNRDRNLFVGVRLNTSVLTSVVALATARGCSRSEAIRVALSIGVPLALQSTTINMRRIASLLEFATAGIGIVIRENHSDYEDDLKQMVDERMARYHE